jgi:hypothetical protein
MVGSGAAVGFGGTIADESFGAFFEHAFEEKEDFLTDDGFVVIVMVVLTCIVL